MKTLLLAFLFVLAVNAQPAPSVCYSDRECGEGFHCEGNYCMPVTPGSCPAACWCPGGGAPGCNPQFISQVQKQGLEILVAKTYVKKPVVLAENELRTPFPRILLAHSGTPPPDPDEDGNIPLCSSCGWNPFCWILCK